MTPAATAPSIQPVDSPLLTQPWATVIGGACVVAAGLLAFFVAYYNRRQTEKHWRTTNRQERFTTIASQLADPAPAIRLAGVYAMEALVDDWLKPTPLSLTAKLTALFLKKRFATRARLAEHGARQAQACINVLCAYLRLTPPGMTKDKANTSDDEADHTRDQEVRNSITATIAAHLREKPPGESWSNLDYNLADTVLGTMPFQNTRFVGTVTFARATFRGRSSFDHAEFHTRADFSDCRFEAAPTFDYAIFHESASFTRTIFEASPDFEGAEFRAGCTFYKAEFNRRSWLTDVHFHGKCYFASTVFRDETYFARSHIHDDVVFNNAQFNGPDHDFTALKFEPRATLKFVYPKSWNNMKFDWDDSAVEQPAQVTPGAEHWPPKPRPKKERAAATPSPTAT